MPPPLKPALLPLTVLLVRVNVPLFEMPPPKDPLTVAAHGAVGKGQRATVQDAAAVWPALPPLRIVTPLMFTVAPVLIFKTPLLGRTPVAVDDGGRDAAAGDGEIAGDSEFSYSRVSEIGVWRQDDRVIPCQSVGLFNRRPQRADAVSGGGLANAVAWRGVYHIQGVVYSKGRRLG